MKRMIAVITLIAVILSYCMVSVYADPPGNGNNTLPPGLQKEGKIPPGIAKKIFNDVDEKPWAQKAIEMLKSKGLVKGYLDGSFKPSGSVTRLETVIMALRIMGWEDEAMNIDRLPSEYRGHKVDEWAYGYINIAYEKGILDDVDMMYFVPGEPAKRHEVAKYIIRALGYEDEAQEYMDIELPFVDAPAVPSGSIGYVYLVNEMELMIGYTIGNNKMKFNPMGTLTRAEMAVLFQRLDEKVDSGVDENEVRGEVVKLYADSIEVSIDEEIENFSVSQDVIVYDHDNAISYTDIAVSSYVVMELEDETVVYIEVTDEDKEEDKIISVYKGTVIDVQYDGQKQITIEDKLLKLIFVVIDDVKVYLNDVETNFNVLMIGDSVKVVVDDKNRAREISIDREDEEETELINGIITDLDLIGIQHITVSEHVYGGFRYELGEVVDITIDGEEAQLEDLVIGMEAEATLTDTLVTLIDAGNTQLELEGTIISIADNIITIEMDDETVLAFWITEDVIIQINGNTGYGIGDLSPGNTAYFEVINNTIVEVDVKTQ